MPKIKELLAVIDKEFPFGLQESYDNSGLLIGNSGDEIKGVLVTLDVTEEVVDEAIDLGLNVILAHHPLIFRGLKSLTGKNYVERTVIKAVKNDIAIIASHTNTDNKPYGTNSILAVKLGLKDIEVLVPQQEGLRKLITFVPVDYENDVRMAVFNAGAGVIGNYDYTSFSAEGIGTFRGNENTNPFVGKQGEMHRENEKRLETIFPAYLERKVIDALIKSHPYEEVAYDIIKLENNNPYSGSGVLGTLEREVPYLEILNKVKEITGAGSIKYTKPHKENVKKIAVCGGTCIFSLPYALAKNADMLITSDVKYHEYFDALGKIILADVGHYEMEQFVKEIFLNLITKNFSNFAVRFSEINTNPVNYL